MIWKFTTAQPVLWLAALTMTSLMPSVYGQNKGLAQQHAKAVLHDDGTRSESVKDNNKREISETTYDARGIAVSKKIFLLNNNGEATQGVIYDGAGNVIAKVQFYFDDLGRPIEERCVNMQGQIFRRVIRQYDPAGNPLQPQAFDYAVNAPGMRAAPIDFTRTTPNAATANNATANVAQQPGQSGQIMSVSASSGQVTSTTPAVAPQNGTYSSAGQQMPQQQAAPQQEKKKKGFFNFGGKK